MTKRFLSVGINKYQSGGNDLRGCVPDARRMAALLTSLYGFSGELLLDTAATRGNIMGILAGEIAKLKAGDVLVWWQSSHGSQVRDTGGDETDGLDECLCCHDWPAGRITDDDVLALANKVPAGATLVIGADSCHSGTMERRADGSRPRYMQAVDGFYDASPPAVRRMWGRAAPVVPRGFWSWLRGLFGGAPVAPASTAAAGGSIVLLAACREDQTAADACFPDGSFGGAFTRAVIDSLGENSEQDYTELIADVQWRLGGVYSQVPQLRGTEAAFETPVFGGDVK